MKKLQGPTEDWKIKLETALDKYEYQDKLTKKLDAQTEDFTEITLLEIVLWKTNRYPEINHQVLKEINDLRKDYSEEKMVSILRSLLKLKGFDLPMASTVLRFACPDKVQIIDQRVYRFITPGKDHLHNPHNHEEKIDLYRDYLKMLRKVCQDYNIPFNKSDRILYQLDKTENKDFKLTNYGSN